MNINNQMTFLARNAGFTVKNPRKAWKTRKRMNEHRKEHPNCKYCGRSPIHVHHIITVKECIRLGRIDLVWDKDNFLSLCGKRCHIAIGHGGNYKHVVVNAVEICDNVIIKR
jgi:hypothetical protein